jgi:hypothetical protein
MMAPNSSAASHELRDRTEVAVHREHAVGDDQLARARGQVLEDGARGVHVLVREDLDGGATQPGAVDDAGVVERIGDDEVVLAEHRGDGAGVGGEAALEHHHGLDVLERREPALELHVQFHRPGDGADRAGADAVLRDRVERRLFQLRMRREAEVVVRGEIDHRAMVETAVRQRLAVHHAEPAMEALLLESVEFGREV